MAKGKQSYSFRGYSAKQERTDPQEAVERFLANGGAVRVLHAAMPSEGYQLSAGPSERASVGFE